MNRHASTGAAVASLWLAGTLAACSRPEPLPEPVRSVRTITVDAPDAQAASGAQEFAAEARSRVESRLGFRVPGKLVSRSAEVGQRVRAAQVLAQIDAVDLQLAQQAAAAATRAAQVQLDQAAADHRRFQGLRAQGFISEAELERRESSLKAAQAQLEQARAQAEAQRNQAGYAALVAPAAGIVTAVEAEVGAVLAAGTPVVRLAHDGPRDVVFAVPEDAVGALRALLGRPDALRVRPWGAAPESRATVREVAAAADPATRTFLVKADAGGVPLQLGQTVTVALDRPPLPGAIRLPLTAVTQQQGRTSVWRVDPATMTVHLQPVEVAGAEGNAVRIGAGLVPGQIVVSAGVHVLTPGQKVRFMPAPAAAASAPGAAASR
jgi:RND family efflux transporter MFP subunit